MIESLVYLLIWLLVLGLIYWLATVVIAALPIPEPVKSVVRIVVLVIVILVVIYLLVGFLPPLHSGGAFLDRRLGLALVVSALLDARQRSASFPRSHFEAGSISLSSWPAETGSWLARLFVWS